MVDAAKVITAPFTLYTLNNAQVALRRVGCAIMKMYVNF